MASSDLEDEEELHQVHSLKASARVEEFSCEGQWNSVGDTNPDIGASV